MAIYPNYQRPTRVHAAKADQQAMFFPNCPESLPRELQKNGGLSAAELRAVAAAIAEQLALCCEKWRALHDDF